MSRNSKQKSLRLVLARTVDRWEKYWLLTMNRNSGAFWSNRLGDTVMK
jgi:hypothetical protein